MSEWFILFAANVVFCFLAVILGIVLGSYVRNRVLAFLVVFLVVSVGFGLPASLLGRYLLDRPVPTKAWLVFPLMGMFLGLIAAIGAMFAWKPLSPEQMPLWSNPATGPRQVQPPDPIPEPGDGTIQQAPAEITEAPAGSDGRDGPQDKGTDE